MNTTPGVQTYPKLSTHTHKKKLQCIAIECHPYCISTHSIQSVYPLCSATPLPKSLPHYKISVSVLTALPPPPPRRQPYVGTMQRRSHRKTEGKNWPCAGQRLGKGIGRMDKTTVMHFNLRNQAYPKQSLTLLSIRRMNVRNHDSALTQ